jgi:hypothetical protein
MHGARLGREACESDGRGGCGEVDNGLRLCENLERIIGHSHAHLSPTHRGADILADPCMACAFQCAHKMALVRGHNRLNQHLSHTARSASDYDIGCIGHGVRPLSAFGEGIVGLSGGGNREAQRFLFVAQEVDKRSPRHAGNLTA